MACHAVQLQIAAYIEARSSLSQQPSIKSRPYAMWPFRQTPIQIIYDAILNHEEATRRYEMSVTLQCSHSRLIGVRRIINNEATTATNKSSNALDHSRISKIAFNQ